MSEERPLPPHPIGGVDYPRTLPEFDEWFATEKKCAEYLQRLRWPAGFRQTYEKAIVAITIEVHSPKASGECGSVTCRMCRPQV